MLVLATALLGLAVSSYLQAYFLDTLVKVAIVIALYVFIGNSGVLSFGHDQLRRPRRVDGRRAHRA